ncbi:MAG: DNA mismatch repair protein MutS, partial [Pseudomonadota bacterium]
MSAGETPMMAHWRSVKADHPDALIFYRLGDFYELFNEDAEVAAAALDIALTKRSKDAGAPAMCGVPVKSAESYLSRLVQLGHRVAICEQMEDPAQAKARGAKGALKRAVVRVVTPGTLTEDALLDARAGNHLAAVAAIRGAAAVAWADVSTGRLRVAATTPAEAPALLARIDPRELLSPQKLIEDPDWFEVWADLRHRLAPQADSRFDSAAAEARLKDQFGVAALDAFGDFGRAEVAALGALVGYVAATQMDAAPRLAPPAPEDAGAAMRIDPATRRNLDLFAALDGGRKGALLAAIDRTTTAGGARLLAERLAAPSTDVAEIAARADAIAWLVDRGAARDALRDQLMRAPVMERALARLSARRGG